MPRWTVSIGDGEIIAIESIGAGTVAIGLPAHDPVIVHRAAVEDLRRKLGAAIADEGGGGRHGLE